ncbi:hypothetical protein N7470_002977 [Penicillium chermesinum]|nr:hypothetical protein N7470_002977 [Penicillium chermesinum]
MSPSSIFSRGLSQPTKLLQRSLYRGALPARQPLLSRPSLQASPSPTTVKPRGLLSPTRLFQFRPFSRQHQRLSSAPGPTSAAKKEGGSLGDRLRKLTQEYGWAALGVYLALSALDFPICFLAVQLLGVERVGHLEQVVVNSLKSILPSVWPKAAEDAPDPDGALEKRRDEASKFTFPPGIWPWLTEFPGIWTQLALAYAIHKSVFIFVRVPLTAAVTPKVVKTLRGWGWNIGKKKPKSP